MSNRDRDPLTPACLRGVLTVEAGLSGGSIGPDGWMRTDSISPVLMALSYVDGAVGLVTEDPNGQLTRLRIPGRAFLQLFSALLLKARGGRRSARTVRREHRGDLPGCWTCGGRVHDAQSVGISSDTELLARATFPPEQVPDALEIIGWYDGPQADDVQRAVLTLSKGDIDALFDLVAAAVADFRDVLMWASEPELTPEERAAARARVEEIVREYQQARRRGLEAKYGMEGAEQIERSNKKLFGKFSPSGQGPGPG